MNKKIIYILITLVLAGSLATIFAFRIFTKKDDEGEISVSETISPPDTEEQITLSLPFDKNDPPNMLIPMGETLEHPKPDNPKGHPGIDFLWQNETGGRNAKIYTSLDGEVAAVWPSEGKWDITIKSGKWAIQYGHVVNLDSNIKEGNKVKVGDLIAESENMHWAFGYVQSFEPKYPDYLCPINYFSEEDQKLLLSIPIMEKHKEAGFTEFCSGDYKEE